MLSVKGVGLMVIEPAGGENWGKSVIISVQVQCRQKYYPPQV